MPFLDIFLSNFADVHHVGNENLRKNGKGALTTSRELTRNGPKIVLKLFKL